MTTINIDKDGIFTEIAKITGITGRNIEGGIDRVSATEDERTIVNSMIEESLSSIMAVLSIYTPVRSNTSITLTVPANFDKSSTSAVEDEVKWYVINKSCANWFLTAREGDDHNKYDTFKDRNILNLTYLLSRRIKPVKR